MTTLTNRQSGGGGGRKLVMDMGDGATMNHGIWWPGRNVQLTIPGGGGGVGSNSGFLWSALVRPKASGLGYIISASGDGIHEMLFGLNNLMSDGAMCPTGNFSYSGPGTIGFGDGAIDGVAVGEWAWVSVAYEPASPVIFTYINGLPCSYTPHAGQDRISIQQNLGFNVRELLVGGSDHINFAGRIALISAWDVKFPGNYSNMMYAQRSWAQRFGNYSLAGAGTAPDFYVVYNTPMSGRDQGFHHRPPIPGKFQYHGVPWYEPKTPEWIEDPTCPLYIPSQTAITSQPHHVKAAITVPTPPWGAGTPLMYDDFKGQNVDWLTHPNGYPVNVPSIPSPSLGNTKGGSLGALPWEIKAADYAGGFQWAWGRRSERAVALSEGNPSCFGADISTRNQRVMLKKWGNYGNFGLAFRIAADKNSWSTLITDGFPHVPFVYVQHWTNGALAAQSGPYATPAGWDGWIAVDDNNGDSFHIYAHGTGGWADVGGGVIVDNHNKGGTRVGGYSNGSLTRVDWIGAY